MCKWRLVSHYFEWVWVVLVRWEWVGHYPEWVGVYETLFWEGGGGWENILGGKIFWVGWGGWG